MERFRAFEFSSIRFLHVHLHRKSFGNECMNEKEEEEEETSYMNDIRGRNISKEVLKICVYTVK